MKYLGLAEGVTAHVVESHPWEERDMRVYDILISGGGYSSSQQLFLTRDQLVEIVAMIDNAYREDGRLADGQL